MICSKKNTNMRCQGRKWLVFCPECDWQVFHISLASELCGVVAPAQMRVISAAFVVEPLTKCVYHHHSHDSGSDSGRASIVRIALAYVASMSAPCGEAMS